MWSYALAKEHSEKAGDMTRKVLGRSPWRWAILVVGLFFTAAPVFTMFPWKAWYLGTVPDALITVVLPVVILLFRLWIVNHCAEEWPRAGWGPSREHPVHGTSAKGAPRGHRGIGAELGHNLPRRP